MEADRIRKEFADRVVPLDGHPLVLRSDDALQLINRAAERGVPVVVVDGLEPGGSPRHETADFSAAVGEGHGCWIEAEAFVRDRMDRGMVFSLALGSDPLNAA
jgi:hypothetical protein